MFIFASKLLFSRIELNILTRVGCKGQSTKSVRTRSVNCSEQEQMLLASIFVSPCYCQCWVFSFTKYVIDVFVGTCVRCSPLEWEIKKICFI
jgi:hypothetical protein